MAHEDVPSPHNLRRIRGRLRTDEKLGPAKLCRNGKYQVEMPNESLPGRTPAGVQDADPLTLALALFEQAGDLRSTIGESFPQLWRCARAVAGEWQLALRPPGRRDFTGGQSTVEHARDGRSRTESPDFIRTDRHQPRDARNPLAMAGLVFTVDPLLRMLIGLAWRSKSGQTEAGAMRLAEDLLDRHRTTRDLAMQTLLHASPAQWNTVRQLDVDRRQLERWSDLLLASLPAAEHTVELAFCEETYRQLLEAAPEMVQRSESHTAAEQRLMVARLTTPRLQCSGLLRDPAAETAGLRGLLSCVRECLTLADCRVAEAPAVVSSRQTANVSPWLPVATPGLRRTEPSGGGDAAAEPVRPPAAQAEKRSRISWSRLARTLSDSEEF